MPRTKAQNRQYQKDRLEDPEKRQKHYDLVNKQRHATREWYRILKSGLRCTDPNCPWPDVNPVCLDFHHPPGVIKVASVTTLVNQGKPREVILAEMAKCEVICSNCHRIHTDKMGRMTERPAFKEQRVSRTNNAQMFLRGFKQKQPKLVV